MHVTSFNIKYWKLGPTIREEAPLINLMYSIQPNQIPQIVVFPEGKQKGL
jgi:hypothetical protein